MKSEAVSISNDNQLARQCRFVPKWRLLCGYGNFAVTFNIIFHHFNTQYHDVPPHSHHPNHLSPSYTQSSLTFQFKPPTDRFKSPSSPCYSHIRRSTTSVAGSRTTGPM